MTTLWLAILLIATQIAIVFHVNAMEDHLVEHLDRQTHHLEGQLMSEAQDTINAVVAQLGKAKDEVLSKIADLNVQIQDAGVADKVDLTELTAAAQALDDIVPDAADNNPPF